MQSITQHRHTFDMHGQVTVHSCIPPRYTCSNKGLKRTKAIKSHPLLSQATMSYKHFHNLNKLHHFSYSLPLSLLDSCSKTSPFWCLDASSWFAVSLYSVVFVPMLSSSLNSFSPSFPVDRNYTLPSHSLLHTCRNDWPFNCMHTVVSEVEFWYAVSKFNLNYCLPVGFSSKNKWLFLLIALSLRTETLDRKRTLKNKSQVVFCKCHNLLRLSYAEQIMEHAQCMELVWVMTQLNPA